MLQEMVDKDLIGATGRVTHEDARNIFIPN